MTTHRHEHRPDCVRMPDVFPGRCCNVDCLKPINWKGHHVVFNTSAHTYVACSPECLVAGQQTHTDVMFESFKLEKGNPLITGREAYIVAAHKRAKV